MGSLGTRMACFQLRLNSFTTKSDPNICPTMAPTVRAKNTQAVLVAGNSRWGIRQSRQKRFHANEVGEKN